MFVNLNPKKRNWNDTSILNRGYARKDKKPRLSDGHTGARTKQNHVSVTVTFNPMNDLRVHRKELALPNCWIDSGEQNQANIQQVRRGDIFWTITDSVPFSHATGITNHAQGFTHLNRWPKKVKIRVLGIVDNPSNGRGQDTARDTTGTISQRGVHTIVNYGSYMIVAGDRVFALPYPEITEFGGVTWSMNAVKGTGDGSGPNVDYTQKLIARLIPLKSMDIKLTLESLRFEVNQHIQLTWNQQKENVSIKEVWATSFKDLESNLKADVMYLFPGLLRYTLLNFCQMSLERAVTDYHLGIDKANTSDLIKIIYTQGVDLNNEYWAENAHIFSQMSNPDDLKRLSYGEADWLVPMGIIKANNILKSLNSLTDLETFTKDGYEQATGATISDQFESTKKNPLRYLHNLINVLTFTQGWIEANDITYALESYYVGQCVSAQAAPGHQFDISR